MRMAVGCGIVLGVLYTLSPLTVLSLAAIAVAAWASSRDMSPRERAWFLGVLALAMALRLAAIAALFVFADSTQPFASFFGDEELFKNRTIWLRNVYLGIPISPADMIYVFDEVGRSSYLYLLAYIQALVGDAPYGLNVLNACWYVLAVMLLHHLARRGFGPVAALGGMVVLVLLPSLFSWSVSVLKEPLYILVAAFELWCAVAIVRARSWPLRIAAIIAVILCAYVLGTVRVGGSLLVVVGASTGIAATVLLRPRLVAATLLVMPLIIGAALLQPAIQQRALRMVQEGAFQHTGHVVTPGYSYELLDPSLYDYGSRLRVFRMTTPEAARYVVRSLASFVTVPRPSHIESRRALAYLPEHAAWYAMLALLPIGVVAGFRRDPVLTCLLLSHGIAATLMVALTGGNIGTLIRHRGMTLPYFCWFAALGAVYLMDWVAHVNPRAARAPLSSGARA